MTTATDTTPTSWDQPIAALLGDLSTTQGELLTLLARKRELIGQRDTAQLAALEPEERRLAEQLAACQQRRQELLASAADEGLPADSLQALAAALPREQRERVTPEVKAARQRSRLLQHQSLTNWVLVQRSLLHLSQMIEIIATGGEGRSTYGDDASSRSSGGVLVDHAV